MLLELKNVNKTYGRTTALEDISLQVDAGEIVGIFGPNGAGKSTMLRSILGLSEVEGQIEVAGLTPRKNPSALMEKVSFIADTATLPRWMRVQQCLNYVENIHPAFDPQVARAFLEQTEIQANSKISHLSKGMVVQLHLAIVMSIDSSLLVLDEPTLGLDIIYRKRFYQALLENYFAKDKTIILTTHQIEEVEDLLTRVVFINKGKIILDCKMEELASRFVELKVPRGASFSSGIEALFSLDGLEGTTFWYQDVEPEHFKDIGTTKVPGLADLFVALVEASQKTQGVAA